MNLTVSLEELSIKVSIVLEQDIRSKSSIILALLKNHELDANSLALLAKSLKLSYCPRAFEELVKQKNISAETIESIVSDSICDAEGILSLAARKVQTNRDTLRLILHRTVSLDTFKTALNHKNLLPEDIAEQMYNSEYAFKSYLAKEYLKKPSTSAQTLNAIAKNVVDDWGCESILLEIAKHRNTDAETLFWLATDKSVLNCFCFADMTGKLKEAIASNPNVTDDILKELKKI